MSDDDEKWLNIVKPIENNNNSSTTNSLSTMVIQLQPIVEDDISQSKTRFIPRRTKRNHYFVKDENCEISDEDMQYQMINVADTQVKKKTLISDLIEENFKTLENFDKLLKSPERPLTPKLIPYFTRNLKKSIDNSVEDFEISYDEINEANKNLSKILKRKNNSSNNNNGMYDKKEKSTVQNSLTSQNLIMESFDDFMIEDQVQSSKLHNTKSSHNNKSSLLSYLDQDFKPTILLSTKTYSRVKIND